MLMVTICIIEVFACMKLKFAKPHARCVELLEGFDNSGVLGFVNANCLYKSLICKCNSIDLFRLETSPLPYHPELFF